MSDRESYSALVMGSTISPHTLQASRIKAVRRISRQSVISGMSAPGESASLGALTPTVPTAQRALDDLRSSAAMWIRIDAKRIDGIVLDITDERFGIQDLGNGIYRTNSPDYTSYPEALSKYPNRRTIAFGTDEHFDLFRLAAARLATLVNAVELGTRVVLLAPSFAKAYKESHLDSKELQQESRSLDQQFAKYWGYLHDVCGFSVLAHQGLKTSATHPWGAAPFHFDEAGASKIGKALRLYVNRWNEPARRSEHPLLISSAAIVPERAPKAPTSAWRELLSSRASGLFSVDTGTGLFSGQSTLNGRFSLARTPIVLLGTSSGQPGTLSDESPVVRALQALDIPHLTIYDPGSNLLPRGGGGWFAGSQWFPVQDELSAVLSQVEDELERPLALIGLGQSGFAALDQLSRAPGRNWTAITLNAEVSLRNCSPVQIQRFLASSYPSALFARGMDSLASGIENASARFGLRHCLLKEAESGLLENSILLSQATDHRHVHHFLPLMRSAHSRPLGSGCYKGPTGVTGIEIRGSNSVALAHLADTVRAATDSSAPVQETVRS